MQDIQFKQRVMLVSLAVVGLFVVYPLASFIGSAITIKLLTVLGLF